MTTSLYERLKTIREKLRPTVKAEPRITQGAMMPSAAGNFEETPLQRSLEGVEIWKKISLLIITDAAETLGWKKYINLIDTEQRKAKDKGYKGAVNLVKQYGIEGDNVMSAVSTMVAHAMGGGFNYFKHTYMSEKKIEAYGSWCPLVEGVHDLGIADRARDMRLFCDSFDDLNTQIVNKNIWMIHSHCPLKGDKYCRFFIEEKDTPPKGDTYYDKVKWLNDKKFEEVEATAPEPDFYQGITSPRFIEQLTPEYIAHDGVLAWGRIAQETITILANQIGWPKFLDIIEQRQTWGLEKMALKLRAEHNIQGSSLRSVGVAVAFNYVSMGFDNHHMIEFTDERVEGIGHSCPIVESAERLEMGDNIEDMSLWCDFFHNHTVHAINKEAQLCHTHCLGRGDKYCRFVIEKKSAIEKLVAEVPAKAQATAGR
jgi:hypothetical protein